MATIRELADRHWEGEGDLVHEHHPVQPVNRRDTEELEDGVLYVKSVASMSALDTGDGRVMLDTGGSFDVDHVYESVRSWRAEAPLVAAVSSHHHVDHIFATRRFEEEAVLAEPGSTEAHGVRTEVYRARAGQQGSSMARDILAHAALSSEQGIRDHAGQYS